MIVKIIFCETMGCCFKCLVVENDAKKHLIDNPDHVLIEKIINQEKLEQVKSQ